MHRLVAILALCVTAVFAQTNRGSISGTVSDQTQAVMGGVTVTITNLGTNEVRKVTTAANGSYSATNLEPVSYKVEAESAGFKKTVVDDAKVDTATNTTVNIVLQAGSVETQVTVSAEATSVNTESGSLSSTVTERQIQDVPLRQPQRSRSGPDAAERQRRCRQRESRDHQRDPVPGLQPDASAAGGP